jgi:hypothetical protein
VADLLDMDTPLEVKGGLVTFDPRLDRVPEFDVQSLDYPVTATIETKKQRSYTWKGGPVTDQGREGACVGHGWTGELTAKPVPIHVPDPAGYAFGLYKRAQQIDEWPGEAYSGTSVLAGAKELAARGLLKQYSWAFGLNDLILGIGYRGPAVLGIPWYESMYVAKDGKVTVSGRQVGGHCILARGVSVRRRQVLLRNSWGVGWGNGGDAVISFDDLDRLLHEGGEACIPTFRLKKAV